MRASWIGSLGLLSYGVARGSITRDVQVCHGVEPIRRRPGMYIGDVASAGLHALIWGLVDPVVELARAGDASRLEVSVDLDGWITLRDDGPGLPLDTLEALFTSLRGMHATSGYPIASALSASLDVHTTRGGEVWTQTYHRGVAATALTKLGPSSTPGTAIRFRPDSMVFSSCTFDPAVIAKRLQTLAWLTPRLEISWQGQRLHGTRGIAGWAMELCAGLAEAELAVHALPQPGAAADSHHAVAVDIALAWRGDGKPLVRGFVDTTETSNGPHVDAMWTGLASLASRVAEQPIEKPRARLGPGLVALVRVTLPEPWFADQAKTTLTNAIAGLAVERAFANAELADSLRRFLLARLL